MREFRKYVRSIAGNIGAAATAIAYKCARVTRTAVSPFVISNTEDGSHMNQLLKGCKILNYSEIVVGLLLTSYSIYTSKSKNLFSLRLIYYMSGYLLTPVYQIMARRWPEHPYF
jgi:hypothetical protein